MLEQIRCVSKVALPLAASVSFLLGVVAIEGHSKSFTARSNPPAYPTDASLAPLYNGAVPGNISAATLKSWFASGKPELNGYVQPANSVAFVDPASSSWDETNGRFFDWAEQMF